MGLVLAWAAGLGIVTWRWAKQGAPPTAGTLAAASGFFAILALLHEYAPARGAATALAWGVDLAALLQVLPGSQAVQVTGWPPLLINDPTVLLPRGSAGGGQLLPEGSGTSGTPLVPGPGSGTVPVPGVGNVPNPLGP